MRALNIVCGIAVLLTTLHFAHGIHHIYAQGHHHEPVFRAAMALAAVIFIFSFIGGCLLLKRSR